MGSGYFTKTHIVDFESRVILFQALAQSFKFTRYRAVQDFVANSDDQAAQNGWIHPKGNIFRSGLRKNIFLYASFFIFTQGESAGHLSSFALEIRAIQDDQPARFHAREEFIEQGSLFLFI